jgi:hypothetical protein
MASTHDPLYPASMLRKRDVNGGLRPVSGHLDSPTLPELHTTLVPDNLRAAAALYYAARLDELGLFAVADEVAREFVAGNLQTGPSSLPGAYLQRRDERPSDSERAAACARVVGCGPGTDDPATNHEVPPLLHRWLLTAAGDEPDADIAGALARALAANLSRRSTPLVREIHAHLGAAVELLASPEILQAYGARDLWQVIERVATTRLQRTIDVAPLRAQAVAGTAALEWLADHAAAADFTLDESLSHIANSWVS